MIIPELNLPELKQFIEVAVLALPALAMVSYDSILSGFHGPAKNSVRDLMNNGQWKPEDMANRIRGLPQDDVNRINSMGFRPNHGKLAPLIKTKLGLPTAQRLPGDDRED